MSSEALSMEQRSEREFMGRMESNHAKLTEFSRTVESFTQDYQRLYATYTSYREMLRQVIAERDQLRAEVERLRKPLTPDELADLCEAWLQKCQLATNIVDAFEAGARAIEVAKEAK